MKKILLLPLECNVIFLLVCTYTSFSASTVNVPSVIIPVLPLPNIINSLALADNMILSEFTHNWSPVNLSDVGNSLKASFVFLIVSLNGTFTLPDVK